MDAEPSKVNILGVGVHNVSLSETLRILDRFIEQGVPRLVVTADAAGIVAAQSDPDWRRILQEADLVTPDSVGVLWASKRVGSAIAERVSGVELVEQLVAASKTTGYRIYFLGAAPGVAQEAQQRMQQKYPGSQIVGARDGFFAKEEEQSVVAEVAEAKPDVLFVAMGIPKQEKFLREHMHAIGAAVNMGVGGSFDVLSGRVRRAPKALQRLRLEWLWRLAQNPKKWKKVAALPKFWWLVVKSPRAN